MSQEYVRQLRKWIYAIVEDNPAGKPTEVDIVTAFSDLMDFLEQDQEDNDEYAEGSEAYQLLKEMSNDG
jgi:hypothetical protein